MTIQELNVTITPLDVKLAATPGTPTKVISHKDFLQQYSEAFEGEINEGRSSDQPGFMLPQNTYYFKESANKLEIGMYFKGAVRDVQYDDDDEMREYSIPLPNIIISLVMNRHESNAGTYYVNTSRFFATDKPLSMLPHEFILSPDTDRHIWSLPLPNMYSEGKMCLGDNSFIPSYTNNLTALIQAYTLIYGSPFNSDLSVPSIREGHGARRWLSHLDGKSEFPYGDLSNFNADLHQEARRIQQLEVSF